MSAQLRVLQGGTESATSPKQPRGLPTGIRRRHCRTCPAVASDDMAVCTCSGSWPHYQVQAGPRADRRTRTFHALKDAVRWRARTRLELDGSGGRVPRVRDAGERFLAAIEAGTALSRSGTPYRPSTVNGYRRELRQRIYPAIGDRRLDAVTRGDVLALSGGMQGEGLAPTTVRNTIVPLRALYRWAADHDITARNPTRGLAMPGVSGSRRERFATPSEVRALLASLDPRDRALWATAAFAGLRRGELMGLRWSDVDLDAGELHVRQAFSPAAKRMGPPKTKAGQRTVPLSAQLAELLAAHRELSRGVRAELVFARGTLADANRGHRGSPKAPFSDSTVGVRALRVWRSAGLEPLGMHEARHTFASSLLAAGVPMKVVSALMGHTTIAVTVDLYSHLLPGAGADAIAQLDRWLKADQINESEEER